MAHIPVNGIELFCERSGRGEPLVLINGIMMTARGWTPQLAALEPHYDCLLYDLRGQYLSDKPAENYSFEQHADDLAALLDALDVGAAHIVGNSYGGAVAMAFAARYPERARSLAVIASTARGDGRQRARFQGWLDIVERIPREIFRLTLADNFSADFIAREPQFVAKSDGWTRSREVEYFHGVRRLLPSIRDVDLLERLPAITCPSLVMVGDADALVGVAPSRAIAAAIPDAELLLVPGGGHAVTLERPQAVNRALLGFLRRQEARADG